MLASVHVSTSALNQAVVTDTQVVRGFVDDLLKPADLTAPSIAAERQPRSRPASRSFITPARDHPGRDPASRRHDPRERRADRRAPRPGLGRLADGPRRPAPRSRWPPSPQSEAGPGDLGTDHGDPRIPAAASRTATVVGVVGVWRDATPIMTAIDAARRDVMVVTVGAAIAAAGVLYLVFRAAQERISSQTVALVEATRRDPFTGMLNHGALVETIGAAIERLRGTAGGLEIAILDIDNFRILNDTWGHAAGDEAIRAVQRAARAAGVGRTRGRPLRPGRVPDRGRRGARWGRSNAGPRRVRRALADVRLRFGDSNDLPLTVSGAVARFPEDGDSVTELLANAAVTLREARAGGGDAVLMTGFEPEVDRPVPHLRRVPGPDPRRRRQGPLHQAPLRGRRALRDVPRLRSSGSARRRSARSGWPGCSTTSARSASRTRSCASPAS